MNLDEEDTRKRCNNAEDRKRRERKLNFFTESSKLPGIRKVAFVISGFTRVQFVRGDKRNLRNDDVTLSRTKLVTFPVFRNESLKSLGYLN